MIKVKHKLRKINTILIPFNVQLRKGNYFLRPSTKLVKSFNKENLVCIEIGVYEGINAKNIFQNLDVKKIYLIDPYETYIETTKKEFPKRVMGEEFFLATKKRLKGFLHKIEFIKKYSEEAVKMFKDESIDFIYVDGNHGYDFVKKDLELYYPKLKKGGVIAGDDIDLEDIFRAVSEFCVKNNLRCVIKDNDWIIIK